MSPTPAPAAAVSATSADYNPVLPLTQGVLPPSLSQPPLPPLDDDVQVEIQPDLSLHEDCSFAGSDRTPTAIVVNESTEQLANDLSNRVPHDPGWEQFLGGR